MDWFNKRWQDLKSNLVMLITKEIFEKNQALLKPEMAHDLSEEIFTFIYLKAQGNASGKWDAGLALLGEFSGFLSDFLSESINNLESDSTKSYFGQAFKQYLENQRRELVALDLDDEWTSSKIKAWERLQRISNIVAGQLESKSLCSEEHFQNILNYINTEFTSDYNYPHKISTIRTYFFKMSASCKEVISLGYELEDYIAGGTMDVVAEELLGNSEMKVLSEALNGLDPDEYEIINIEFKLELSKTFPLTKDDFRSRKGLSNRDYAKMRESALSKLKDIFHDKHALLEGHW
jgi:hypothetical protein